MRESAGKDITDPADFEEFFAQRLESHYVGNKEEFRFDQTETEELRARLREANAAFVKSRRTDTSLEERERALQKLETGYSKFLEIAQNLDEGRKFYNELARMLSRYREEIRGFVYQRKKDARDLEGYESTALLANVRDLSGEMSRLTLSDGNAKNPYTAKSPPADRRTSQRVTRATSRQVKENNGNDANAAPDGNNTPGVWTPGTSFKQSLLTSRPRNSIRLNTHKHVAISIYQLLNFCP